MDLKLIPSRLTPSEEAFLQALLWEEGRMMRGPATQAAEERGLSLLRCLEPANRLSPNLHGEALNRLRESVCPPVEWPWKKLTGAEVLQMLWARLVETNSSSADAVNTLGHAAPHSAKC